MEPDKPGLPAPIRGVMGFTLVIQVLIAASALIGGPVQIVGGLIEADWGRVAAGVVGLLLGGAFAAMAYGHWSAHRPES